MSSDIWIVEQDRSFTKSLLKSFTRLLQLEIETISAAELERRLASIQSPQTPGNAPILILLDVRLPRKMVEATVKWRKLLWSDQKYPKFPMIDFFITPPQHPGRARKNWSKLIETYPDDYHFCTIEQLRTEFMILAKRARARRLYAEYGMVMSSTSPLQKIKLYIDRLANTDTNIYITGETGTGKDLVARALHARGKRSKDPFIAINCSAIPETLLESELFGYEKGAFTGAERDRMGRIQQAHKGTLFLNEIGEMPLTMQVKLLHVLQEREVTPLGSNKTLKLDIRVISATLKNLEEEVAHGNFRQDLFYRLSGWPIDLPPLRERGRDDLLLLIEHFLIENAPKTGSAYKSISERAMQALLEYPWPGNIRELDQVIERALISCDIRGKEQIELKDLHLKSIQDLTKSKISLTKLPLVSLPDDIQRRLNPYNDLELTLNHCDQIKSAIEICQGKLSKTAKLLKDAGYQKGASRGRLRNLIGLTETRDAADSELSAWFAQKYPKKTPNESL